MRSLRRLRRVVLPLAGAAVLVLAGPATTGAAPAPAPDTATTASPAPRLSGAGETPADSPAAAATLARYWTPERMKAAIPLDTVDLPPTAATAPVRPAVGGKPAWTRPAPGRPGRLRVKVSESSAVGKVFFTDPSDGLGYSCSAAAVDSPSKQMLITAGHCVHEGSGGTWMADWVYVPRYRDGATPLGIWAAQQFRTFDAWIASGDLRRDVGVVTTWPLAGGKVVNVTGGEGLSWNFPREQAVTVFGYPSNFADGEVQSWCTGTTRAVADGRVEIACDFQPGSSGGPWLREFDEALGLGYVNGVTSTVTEDGWNRSPYFDDAVKAMYDAQGSVV